MSGAARFAQAMFALGMWAFAAGFWLAKVTEWIWISALVVAVLASPAGSKSS